MKPNIFVSRCTCMEVSVSLSCLFVHEPPYQDYSSVLQSRFLSRFFAHGPPHRFHVRVGLAQARPNNDIKESHVNRDSSLRNV